MPEDGFKYELMVENALRQVVSEALTRALERGLPGQHHFYITFRTDRSDVLIPERLRQQYPREMTIVLQHQYWGLEIEPTLFRVTLSFGGQQERLVIPFVAITGFADPSVKFGLQFEARPPVGGTLRPTALPSVPDSGRQPEAKGEKPVGEVVALDTFRKK
jgi:hypothetical protein